MGPQLPMETKSILEKQCQIHPSESITYADTVACISTIRTVWWDGDETTGSLSGNYYTFTGRRYDPEADLMYYRNRYYSPELGRFVTREPLGYVDSMNLYTYVTNNPVNWLDYSGLEKGTDKKKEGEKETAGTDSYKGEATSWLQKLACKCAPGAYCLALKMQCLDKCLKYKPASTSYLNCTIACAGGEAGCVKSKTCLYKVSWEYEEKDEISPPKKAVEAGEGD